MIFTLHYLYPPIPSLKGYAKYASSFDLKSLRFVAAGAEALEQSTIDLWQDKFLINVVSGYGTTEASPGISLNNKMFHKKGTVGRLLPGMSYKLIKHHENDGDDTGELVIKGPNIMLGYIHHDNPKKIAEPKDGWYATGDIVKVDEDGFITILDRRKDLLKLLEKWYLWALLNNMQNNLTLKTNTPQ